MLKKIYVQVEALFKDGKIYPFSIIWHNGKKYTIDKILDIRKIAAPNVGGIGLRYTCKINSKIVHIWMDDNFWFVEAKY